MLIELKNVRKIYKIGHQELHALKGININIGEGELVSIVGPSGSGKSTLLNILGILDGFDEGQYELAGMRMEDLTENKAAYYRNKFIGFIFQSFNLITFKNAMENVALPLYYQNVNRKKRNALALDYLDRVGLRDWAEHLPSELSGGQNQRVAIARALISDPKVILADEPTGALDSETSAEVMELFKEVNKTGITVIIVTHEHDISEQTNRIIQLIDGQIENDGKPNVLR